MKNGKILIVRIVEKSRNNMITELTEDEATDIVYEYGRTNVAVQNVSEHRWYTKQLVVFEDDYGHTLGFYYLDPASELQEDQDRFESVPVKVFPVSGREVTVTVFDVSVP